ncbi:MAG: hypothetical protein ACJAYU_004064 [Bradymonadia bacterium]|jgi:hypothetical protein
MKAMRLHLAAFCMVLIGACADSSNYSAVYVETEQAFELGADRSHAYRVTVFEYSKRVGGFVEFFEIDGVRNTVTNPYFARTECVYFGDGGIANDEFAIDAAAFDESFLARATMTDRRRALRVDVLEPATTWIGGGSVNLERGADSPTRSCESL